MCIIIKRKTEVIRDLTYEKKIAQFFKQWIKGYCHIDYFALVIMLPNNDILHLSTHLGLSQIYYEQHYELYDQALSQQFYTQFPFYPWEAKCPNKMQKELFTIRKKIFHLNSGTMFVRKITSHGQLFHLLYSVSDYAKNPLMYFNFASQVNNILAIGDFTYNTFLSAFQENCPDYILPKIENSTIVALKNVKDVLQHYTFSREQCEDLPSFIKTLNSHDEAANNVRETLKLVYENTRAYKNKTSTPNLYLIKT